jgi:6-pyruvoyltetrahydropterin/6-carboxytetrahydropterin synthase
VALLISRRYDIEAGHRLRAGVPAEHKCRRPHGHRYELTIWVSGHLDESGMLIEYDDLDRLVRPIVDLVDHHSLNDLSERCPSVLAHAVAENPTVERLAMWLAHRLCRTLPDDGVSLARLTLAEDARAAAEWLP